MHGLGNDFVVFDGVRQRVDLSAEHLRFIADRHFGVGCDQVLLVERPSRSDVDFRYRIFNADGGEVEQCGNGARCFAHFVQDQGLTDKDLIAVETAAGIIQLRVQVNGEVTVDMGVPVFEPARIPFEAPAQAPRYRLDINGESVDIGVTSMGNPHAVVQVKDVARAPVERLGAQIALHPRFPKRTNVGFMEVLARNHIRLRVFERGAGETLACGTGACAAVVIGRIQELLGARVQVDLPGGRLVISWPSVGHTVAMTGPATSVFEGTIHL